MIFSIIFIILSCLFCAVAIIILVKNCRIKKEINSNTGSLIQQQQQLQQETNKLIQTKSNLQTELYTLQESGQQKIENNLVFQKENAKAAFSNYVSQLEESYQNAEAAYDTDVQKLTQFKNTLLVDIAKLKQTFEAVTEAQNREKQKQENLTFYTLQIPNKSKAEINIIKSIENDLADARPLKMLIWTTYYSKPANELCSRVLGKNDVTGIYRITNTKTNQCYIGQAVGVKDRWRQHMKCGLGIDTPANNKLYLAMQEYGLEAFTFELIESCTSALLNEKEKFYIDLYSSYDFGYNSTRGNSK